MVYAIVGLYTWREFSLKHIQYVCLLYTVWVKKIPLRWGLVAIFPKWLGIFQPNFMCLLRVPIYATEFLFNYLQLSRSYAILSVTTQFTSCAQNVHHQPKCTLAFSDIFPKQLGIFRPNFTRLLNVYMYARVQILFNYFQLWRSYAILSATSVRFGRWWTIWAHYCGALNRLMT